ncbi:MAG: glycosyltransferase [Aestuariivirga sp.]|nr:glycosyltransferase [Aestuariivirga sp.]
MKTGVVVIGRNEGERLVACLRSLRSSQYPIVYADSGSTDGSVERAASMGAEVTILDRASPFTAARARNAGLARLNELWPNLQYIQFVDGDCVVVGDWLDAASSFLDKHDDVAVVCGRRREKNPQSTIYNWLCDMEWDTPVGQSKACGGDALMRAAALEETSGFNPTLIAGEEPELCLRLREKGWKVWRLPVDMTLHDANIQHFGQWWKRTRRGGFAYAAVSTLHANSEKRIWHFELQRAIFWGAAFPIAVIALGFFNIAVFGLFLAYPLQIARIAVRRDATNVMSWKFALFMTIAKFAEAAGALQFFASKMLRRRTVLIEYK